MLEKLHPIHRLLHRLGLTIMGVHPLILVLGPVIQSGNGMGMHGRELREISDSQGEYPVGPLAEGLSSVHRGAIQVIPGSSSYLMIFFH